MINVAVKHGFVGKQLILWHDRNIHLYGVDVCRCGEIDGLIFPATMTVVVEARMGGGLGASIIARFLSLRETISGHFREEITLDLPILSILENAKPARESASLLNTARTR